MNGIGQDIVIEIFYYTFRFIQEKNLRKEYLYKIEKMFSYVLRFVIVPYIMILGLKSRFWKEN